MAHRPGRGLWKALDSDILVWFHSLICLYSSSVVPDTEKEQEWTPSTGLLLTLKEEDQLLVRRLSRHVLSGKGNPNLHF